MKNIEILSFSSQYVKMYRTDVAVEPLVTTSRRLRTLIVICYLHVLHVQTYTDLKRIAIMKKWFSLSPIMCV